jgi:predicted CXXCH cytochrome family protein
VNGQWRSRATLATGDVVQIGPASIIVHRAQAGAPVVLEVREEPARRAAAATLQPASLRDTRLSVRVMSWVVVLGVLGIFLVPQLSASFYPPARTVLHSGAWVPDQHLWQPGPLHVSHQFIGSACATCHAAPFTRIPNARCTACHKGVQHHVEVRSTNVALFKEQRCGACHVEHLEPNGLVPRDDRLCTDCHGSLQSIAPKTKLANVSDFGTAHPDFKVAAPERSNLSFSHAVHMNPRGIKATRGEETLKCQSCHEPNTSGRQMLPIRMERHCSRCHSLLFDERDPASAVPHGSVEGVFKTLQAHFIRQYLDTPSLPETNGVPPARRPGGEAAIMTRDEQRRARDWAARQSQIFESELIGKRVCVQCHRVSQDGTQWRIEPVRLTQNWMPKARFDHARHITSACTTCHAAATHSKASSDVLLPDIRTCRECHGGSSDSSRLPSGCSTCHQFHLPGRGLFDAGASATSRKK